MARSEPARTILRRASSHRGGRGSRLHLVQGRHDRRIGSSGDTDVRRRLRSDEHPTFQCAMNTRVQATRSKGCERGALRSGQVRAGANGRGATSCMNALACSGSATTTPRAPMKPANRRCRGEGAEIMQGGTQSCGPHCPPRRSIRRRHLELAASPSIMNDAASTAPSNLNAERPVTTPSTCRRGRCRVAGKPVQMDTGTMRIYRTPLRVLRRRFRRNLERAA